MSSNPIIRALVMANIQGNSRDFEERIYVAWNNFTMELKNDLVFKNINLNEDFSENDLIIILNLLQKFQKGNVYEEGKINFFNSGLFSKYYKSSENEIPGGCNCMCGSIFVIAVLEELKLLTGSEFFTAIQFLPGHSRIQIFLKKYKKTEFFLETTLGRDETCSQGNFFEIRILDTEFSELHERLKSLETEIRNPNVIGAIVFIYLLEMELEKNIQLKFEEKYILYIKKNIELLCKSGTWRVMQNICNVYHQLIEFIDDQEWFLMQLGKMFEMIKNTRKVFYSIDNKSAAYVVMTLVSFQMYYEKSKLIFGFFRNPFEKENQGLLYFKNASIGLINSIVYEQKPEFFSMLLYIIYAFNNNINVLENNNKFILALSEHYISYSNSGLTIPIDVELERQSKNYDIEIQNRIKLITESSRMLVNLQSIQINISPINIYKKPLREKDPERKKFVREYHIDAGKILQKFENYSKKRQLDKVVSQTQKKRRVM